MLWIALAGAAQIMPPVPINLSDWIGVRDTPKHLYAMGTGYWLVSVRLTVRPDGRIDRCDLAYETKFFPKLGPLTCSLVLARAKFYPARAADGSAAFGVYETAYPWRTGNIDATGLGIPKTIVEMEKLPDPYRHGALVRVTYGVGIDGRVTTCFGQRLPDFERALNPPELSAVACERLRRLSMIPVKDLSDQPVASIQSATVQFVAVGRRKRKP